MTHSICTLAAALGPGSFFSSTAGPGTALGWALILAATVVLFTSASKATQADLPLPSMVAAVASFAFLLMVLAGASWPS